MESKTMLEVDIQSNLYKNITGKEARKSIYMFRGFYPNVHC